MRAKKRQCIYFKLENKHITNEVRSDVKSPSLALSLLSFLKAPVQILHNLKFPCYFHGPPYTEGITIVKPECKDNQDVTWQASITAGVLVEAGSRHSWATAAIWTSRSSAKSWRISKLQTWGFRECAALSSISLLPFCRVKLTPTRQRVWLWDLSFSLLLYPVSPWDLMITWERAACHQHTDDTMA